MDKKIYAQLAAQHVLNLAYAHADGVGACALWFAADEHSTLFFLSSTKTQHGAALQHGGSVAFTAQPNQQDWRSIQGIQGRGFCTIVPPAQYPSAWYTYTQRYPFVLQQFPDLAHALQKTALWQIALTWLRHIDNTQGFGHKEEWTL